MSTFCLYLQAFFGAFFSQRKKKVIIITSKHGTIIFFPLESYSKKILRKNARKGARSTAGAWTHEVDWIALLRWLLSRYCMKRASLEPPVLYRDWKQCAFSCSWLGSFTRLPGKRDYSQKIPTGTVLAWLSCNGKVDFCFVLLRCRGFTRIVKTQVKCWKFHV